MAGRRGQRLAAVAMCALVIAVSAVNTAQDPSSNVLIQAANKELDGVLKHMSSCKSLASAGVKAIDKFDKELEAKWIVNKNKVVILHQPTTCDSQVLNGLPTDIVCRN
jgi:hypothetical protein